MQRTEMAVFTSGFAAKQRGRWSQPEKIPMGIGWLEDLAGPRGWPRCECCQRRRPRAVLRPGIRQILRGLPRPDRP